MKRSKIIFLFNFLLFISILIYSLNYSLDSYYTDETEIIGEIIEKKVKDENITFVVKAKEKILINCYKCLTNYKLGDIVKIRGYFKEIKGNTNFNLFNYKKYLLSKKITKNFIASEITYLKASNSIIFKTYNKIEENINDLKTSDFLKAMVLGNTSSIDEVTYDIYINNGIVHLFAVSGTQVIIIATIFLFILNKISKYKKINHFISFIIVIFYMLLINSASVIRSAMMYICCSLKKIFNINISTINILYYVFIINVFINPYIIYDMGFQLSYTVVFSLIISNKLLSKFTNYINLTFMTSLISFLASIPIIINSRYELNILTPFINVIMIPVVSFIYFPLAIITAVFPIFDNILAFLLTGFNYLNIFFSKIALVINIPHLNIIMILIYYLLFILFIRKPKYIFLIIIFFILMNKKAHFFEYFSLTILDVGQGDAILITYPYNKRNILIDAGGNATSGANVIVPYLKSIGVYQIDELVITHGDFDHIGNAQYLVNTLKVNKVIFNCGAFNDLEKELMNVLQKKNVRYESCIKELDFKDNKLYFLNNNDYGNENDNSIVLYTKINNYKFLLMGDASKKTEKDILDKYNLKDVDVVKVGHHGSKTSSSKDFVDSINPKYSVISVGKSNRYGHPNSEVLDILDKSKIYRTDIDGSVMFKIKNNKLNISMCPP